MKILPAELAPGSYPAPGLPESSVTAAEVLVLGMGNILLEDEGLGVRAIEQIQRCYLAPPGVELMDGGTSGMSLLDQISGRKHVVILDACQTGHKPGTFVRLTDDEVPVYFGMRITPHQLGLSDVLATLKLTGESPQSVTVLGLVPDSLDLCLELSSLISGRLETLVSACVEELRNLGYTLKKTDKDPRPVANRT